VETARTITSLERTRAMLSAKCCALGMERQNRKKSGSLCCATAAFMRTLTVECKMKRKQEEEEKVK